MKLNFTSFALTALVLGSGFVATRTAEAGIIIMKSGKVFVGRIDPEDIKGTGDEQTVNMHEPKLFKGAPPIHGEQLFSVHDIRWYDANSDEPTDEYMKDHADEPIDPRYQKYIEQYKDRKTQEVTIDPTLLFPKNSGGSKLSPLPFSYRWDQDEITLRKPLNWTPRPTKSGIFIFESDAKPTEANQGFLPKIHLFSVESVKGQPSDQLDWIKAEVSKLAQGESYEEKEKSGPPKAVRGGYDAEQTTITRRNGKSIMALRVVKIRNHRTYFLTCYAHESDYDELKLLFRACVQTLQINEAGTSAGGGEKADTSAVKPGQVYRWKSPTVSDLKSYEIVVADNANVTRKVTRTASDGSKTAPREEPESTAYDPLDRMNAIAGSGINPGKAGTEQITISGQPFDCDIYEASAGGKQYRVWLSKKYPVTIKITVDGAVQEELTEIK